MGWKFRMQRVWDGNAGARAGLGWKCRSQDRFGMEIQEPGQVFWKAAGMVGVLRSAHPPFGRSISPRFCFVRNRNPALHIFLAPSSLWSFPVEEKIPVDPNTEMSLSYFSPRYSFWCFRLVFFSFFFFQNLDFKSPAFPTLPSPFSWHFNQHCLPCTGTIQSSHSQPATAACLDQAPQICFKSLHFLRFSCIFSWHDPISPAPPEPRSCPH